MNTRKLLLKAMIDNPLDINLRLAYADYLGEQGFLSSQKKQKRYCKWLENTLLLRVYWENKDVPYYYAHIKVKFEHDGLLIYPTGGVSRITKNSDIQLLENFTRGFWRQKEFEAGITQTGSWLGTFVKWVKPEWLLDCAGSYAHELDRKIFAEYLLKELNHV